MSDIQIFVSEMNAVDDEFSISIIAPASKSGKLVERRGQFKPQKKIKYKVTVRLLEKILPRVLDEFNYTAIFRSKDKIPFQKIKGALNRKLLQIQYNKSGQKYRDDEFSDDDEQKEALAPKSSEFKILKQKGMRSIFDHPDDSSWAHSQLLFATSYAGKTHWLVDNLNKLLHKGSVMPDVIILCTGSINAAPLKNLFPKIKKRMITIDRYCPKAIAFLVKLQKVLGNELKILLILDDCISGLKKEQFKKLFLVLRNSNINALSSLQDLALVPPDVRQNAHDVYYMKMKQPRWKLAIEQGLGPEIKELTGVSDNVQNTKLAEVAHMFFKDKILHHDQRKDEVHLIDKPPHD
jgi:hypothetical protein